MTGGESIGGSGGNGVRLQEPVRWPVSRNTIRRYFEALERDGVSAGSVHALLEVDAVRARVEEQVPSKSAR